MKKCINRFYVVIAITAIMMFSCIISNNPYQNAFIIVFAFLFYIGAMAYLMDVDQEGKYNHSERRFVDWLNKM